MASVDMFQPSLVRQMHAWFLRQSHLQTGRMCSWLNEVEAEILC